MYFITIGLSCCRAERDGEWKTWTFQQYYAEVAAAAKSLIRLGLERFHGVCILGFNAPEWFIAYLSGIMVSIRGVYIFHIAGILQCPHPCGSLLT